ncbi:hypothetical protein RZS08_37975, partial [Arthrospira platensis SPKY1]|nr:hypothetical protein [Arthrospira platensis SPKY1]
MQLARPDQRCPAVRPQARGLFIEVAHAAAARAGTQPLYRDPGTSLFQARGDYLPGNIAAHYPRQGGVACVQAVQCPDRIMCQGPLFGRQQRSAGGDESPLHP